MEIENLINDIIINIIKNDYPQIVEEYSIEDNQGLKITDFFEDCYIVNIITNECLDVITQVEIDFSMKRLFKLAMEQDVNIRLFFDCGNGDGFVFESPINYKH